MTPHLNAIKARIKKLVEYHTARLGIKAEFYIVETLPKNYAGVAYSRALFFKEGGKWRFYPRHIRLRKSEIENHWNDPGWLDDLVVHELMHIAVGETERRKIHGPVFRKRMMEYGYHPAVMGWRAGRRVPALE